MFRLDARETKTLVAVHGWSGVLLGIILYAVIVTGTAAVFANEIKAWSAGLIGASDPFARPITQTVEKLTAETPAEFHDDISMREAPGGNIRIFFHKDEIHEGKPAHRGVIYLLSPTHDLLSRNEGWEDVIMEADPLTALGRFYVELHVRLHLPKPWGLILTGFLGLAMLLAAVSGILMHRHLFADIFTLRGRSRIVGFRDVHSVAGTWTLPHAFVLAFTGAYLSFAIAMGVPLLTKVAFNGDLQALALVFRGGQTVEDNRPANGADIDKMIADVRQRAETRVISMIIENRGRADARVTFRTDRQAGSLSTRVFVYNGATGKSRHSEHNPMRVRI